MSLENSILGNMNRDIDQLQKGFETLRNNQGQIADAIKMLTQQLSGMEQAQLATEDAIMKIGERLRNLGAHEASSNDKGE